MSTLLTINRVYYLIGIIVMILVVMTLRDRGNPKRFTTALFWFLFGAIFLFGDLMVDTLGKSLAYRIIGASVIAIALLAGCGLVGKGRYPMSTDAQREASASSIKNWLFLPALLIPVITVLCTLFMKKCFDWRRLFARPKAAHVGITLCGECYGDTGRLVANQRFTVAGDWAITPYR